MNIQRKKNNIQNQQKMVIKMSNWIIYVLNGLKKFTNTRV